MKRVRKDGYTEEQIDYLREIGEKTGRTNSEITKMFNQKFNQNRTINSIIGVKSRNGIRSYTRVYTSKQLAYLREVSPGKSHKEITELFNKKFNEDRTESSVRSIMQEKGISLTDDGRFKKGNRPQNILPIGAEIMREDGYLYVKIGQPNKWKQKHRLIWEQHNGSVPDEHVILFGDKDRLNFNIDNLILASKAQVLQLNRYDLIQEDADLTKTALIIADVHLKIGEVKRKSKEEDHD